ncbi:MAG TPA: HAD-IA family hydrolase [Nocardioidaceae bacterium]|nr:HAD-IA family hydrolase [Nocardioidaceae bacterium]
MTVEQLLWDMDGTLLDTTSAVPAAFVRSVRVLAGPRTDEAAVVDAYWRGPPDVILGHLMGRQLDASEIEVYYRELESVEVEPYPGVVATFDALKAQGKARAVFTGASARAATLLLRPARLEVDLLLGGDQVAHPKPAPDGIHLAAQRLGLETERLAYVGDSCLDLQAARAAGSCAAAAGWGHQYDPHEDADVVLSEPSQALALLQSHKT